jgi:hypothetical protein
MTTTEIIAACFAGEFLVVTGWLLATRRGGRALSRTPPGPLPRRAPGPTPQEAMLDPGIRALLTSIDETLQRQVRRP